MMKILGLTEKYDAVKWILECFELDHVFSDSDIYLILDIIGENDFKSIATEIIESMIIEQPPQKHQLDGIEKIVEYLHDHYMGDVDYKTTTTKLKTLELSVELFQNKN